MVHTQHGYLIYLNLRMFEDVSVHPKYEMRCAVSWIVCTSLPKKYDHASTH